jgi:hypothetical protein
MGECNDLAQVRGLANRFANDDEQGMLPELFAQPSGLAQNDLLHVSNEEGWILGVR